MKERPFRASPSRQKLGFSPSVERAFLLAVLNSTNRLLCKIVIRNAVRNPFTSRALSAEQGFPHQSFQSQIIPTPRERAALQGRVKPNADGLQARREAIGRQRFLDARASRPNHSPPSGFESRQPIAHPALSAFPVRPLWKSKPTHPPNFPAQNSLHLKPRSQRPLPRPTQTPAAQENFRHSSLHLFPNCTKLMGLTTRLPLRNFIKRLQSFTT